MGKVSIDAVDAVDRGVGIGEHNLVGDIVVIARKNKLPAPFTAVFILPGCGGLQVVPAFRFQVRVPDNMMVEIDELEVKLLEGRRAESAPVRSAKLHVLRWRIKKVERRDKRCGKL